MECPRFVSRRKDEHRMKIVSTRRSMSRPYNTELGRLTKPSPQRTSIVFINLATRCCRAYSEVSPYMQGGGNGHETPSLRTGTSTKGISHQMSTSKGSSVKKYKSPQQFKKHNVFSCADGSNKKKEASYLDLFAIDDIDKRKMKQQATPTHKSNHHLLT